MLCRTSARTGTYVRSGHSLLKCRRTLIQTSRSSSADDIAFAFDIDGVLLRSSKPIGSSSTALSHLLEERIPFILLTNGGGKPESTRIADLRDRLSIPALSDDSLVQSHTPFRALTHLFPQTVLVVGGEGDGSRLAAEEYGFTSVLTPSDIYAARPSVWPFSRAFAAYHTQHARPLPDPLPPIAAVLVFNDPRDFGLDLQLTIDVLLSDGGRLGTLSPSNGDAGLPGHGYQYGTSADSAEDGLGHARRRSTPPELHFSNPDLWWASDYPLSRLGQGAFRTALEGVWDEITGRTGTALRRKVIGKPYGETYGFAERRLGALRTQMLDSSGGREVSRLRKVYMVGDNPESDIRGANEWKSPDGTEWVSILVRTGVWRGHREPKYKPKHVAKDVWEAVQWALQDAEDTRS